MFRGSRGSSAAAVAGLTATSVASATVSIATVMLAAGPVMTSSRWSAADQEEVEHAAVDPDRHPEGHESGRRAELSGGSHRLLHFECSPARPRLVLLAWNSSKTASPPHLMTPAP